MTQFRQEFKVAAPRQRDVAFILDGEEFACLPDITIAVMEDYRAHIRFDPLDPNKATIPVEAAVQLISDCLAPSPDVDEEGHAAAVKRFDVVRRRLPLDEGFDTVQAVREFLTGAYSDVDPTTEPKGSSNGASANGTGSPGASGE
jgi:hypothetical protein